MQRYLAYVFTVICYPYHDNTEGSVPHIMISPAYLLRNTEVFHLVFLDKFLPGACVLTLYHSKNTRDRSSWISKKSSLRSKTHNPCSSVLAATWWLPRRKQAGTLRSFAASQRGYYTAVLQDPDTEALSPPASPNPSPERTQALIQDGCLSSRTVIINFKLWTLVRDFMVGLCWVYIHQLLECITVYTV